MDGWEKDSFPSLSFQLFWIEILKSTSSKPVRPSEMPFIK